MTEDATIRRVADELEIRNLVARLAQLADMGDLDDYVDAFTEKAEWEMPGNPRHGRADIRAGAEERRATGSVGPASNTRHAVSTIAVSADGGDEATAESYFQFWVETTTEPKVALMGHYHDTFQRTANGWKLARRQITFG
jgi:3-phenylpropionate/cinnamic acid dioxygenase small subunit